MPATHSAEFCVVREETATLYRVTAPADPVLVHGNRLCGAKGPQFMLEATLVQQITEGEGNWVNLNRSW